nr:Mobile element protein [Klebsiella pneumoniae]
MKKTRYT